MTTFVWNGVGAKKFGGTTDLGTAANWNPLTPLRQSPRQLAR
jgi:hypothetical protein